MGKVGEFVETNLKVALKSKDARGLAVLRMLKTALVNERIAKIHDLSDEEEVAVVRRELKKREESVRSFTDAGRPERAEEEKAEAEILKSILPPEMPEEEIRTAVKQVINTQGSENFGKVMGEVMKVLGSRASGDKVREIVQNEIQNKN